MSAPRSTRRAWTADEDARLRELYPVTRTSELPALLGRSRAAIKVRASALHLRKAPEVSMRRPWHPDEDAVLRSAYLDTPTDAIAALLGRSATTTYQRAYKLGLSKSDEYLASPDACRLRQGDNVGAAGRFKPGHVPANKGVRRPPGWAPGRMREGQFRKGEMSGVAAARFKPIGSERMVEGYLYRKVSAEPGPWTRNWKPVHVMLWEEAHGPVPPGHALVFKNRDRTDIRLDNLECITKRDLMLRNSLHNLPAPLPQTIQLLGALTRQINRRTRAQQERAP